MPRSRIHRLQRRFGRWLTIIWGKITDPYRYFENLGDPEVQSWFKAQADYASAMLDNLPMRAGFGCGHQEICE